MISCFGHDEVSRSRVLNFLSSGPSMCPISVEDGMTSTMEAAGDSVGERFGIKSTWLSSGTPPWGLFNFLLFKDLLFDNPDSTIFFVI